LETNEQEQKFMGNDGPTNLLEDYPDHFVRGSWRDSGSLRVPGIVTVRS
jgi:hypothetical protein